MKHLLHLSLPVFLLTILFFIVSVSGISAATFTVTKTADTNDGNCDADCSLREAVVAANTNAGSDLIEFAIPTTDINWKKTIQMYLSYQPLLLQLPIH